MKTFIAFSPQQGNLLSMHYVPQNAPRLEYGETCFPIIPVISGYTAPGDSFRVILIVQDHDYCRANKAKFVEELEKLCAQKNITCEGIEEINAAFDDSVSTHVATFQKLIDRIHDGDDLHACITYGSKPSPMVELMALRYARMVRKGACVSCIVYGQVNFKTGEAKIYDETALVHLDDIMHLLAVNGEPDPKKVIDQIIDS